jgi:group I intron endonuclease
MERKVTSFSEIPEFVQGEIYLAKNKINGKPYIGQTRTHIMNHGKYRPFGSQKRWIQHVSEAIGNYKHQSTKLNNAIRKYGSNAFEVIVLETCPLDCLNDLEKIYIEEFDSINNGYNLTHGGDKKFMTEEGKLKVANTLIEYYKERKLKKFEGKIINSITISHNKYIDKDIIKIRATITVDKKFQQIYVDFGGKQCKIKDSFQRAKEFALILVPEEKITIQPKLQELIMIE